MSRNTWSYYLRLPWAAVLITVLVPMLTACMRPAAQDANPTWTVPGLPDTLAGATLGAYIQVMNSGDKKAISEFVAKEFTPVGPGGSDIKERTRSQLRFYNSSHGLNLFRVDESADTSITVTAQLRLTQEWRQITFELAAEPPHQVSGVKIMPTEAPVIPTDAAQQNPKSAQQIDAYVQNLVAADRFSGVVLVAKDGVPFFQGAYGMANNEDKIPNGMATRFGLASTSKMFTAVAIAQLVEQGRVRYDDPISRHLQDYPTDVARRVTIDHLLTHRSGIADYFADQQRFAIVQHSRNPQRDYLKLFVHEPLRFAPGEKFEYSNSNYILLGAIIERVSGQRYEDYVRTRIFEPAGMRETSFSADGVAPALLAHGYTEMDVDGTFTQGTRRPSASFDPAVASAAGGAYATAGDLLKFDRALRGHKLLSPEATEKVLVDRVDYERPGYRYGYGFIVRQLTNERIVGHSGGFPGVDAQFEMYMSGGYTVIALSNYELVAEPIAMRLQTLLLQPHEQAQ